MTNFNLNANTYYAYMRTLAAKHKDIGPDTKNSKRFFQGELEDFCNGLRSDVVFPALVVEGFKINLTDNQETKYRESAFAVVYNYDEHGSIPQQTEGFSNSEDIGSEILRRMMEDGDEADCIIRIEDISGILILNETKRYCAVRFSFTLHNGNDTEIDTDKWR